MFLKIDLIKLSNKNAEVATSAVFLSTCQPVILSGEKRLRFAQSKFCGLSVSEQAKPRSDSDDGISEQVWVAF